MSEATLEKREIADGTEAFVVDCEHGTTTIYSIHGDNGPAVTDAISAAAAVFTHYDEEHCACTAELRERYGLEYPFKEEVEDSRNGGT